MLDTDHPIGWFLAVQVLLRPPDQVRESQILAAFVDEKGEQHGNPAFEIKSRFPENLSKRFALPLVLSAQRAYAHLLPAKTETAFQDRKIIEDIYHEFPIKELMRAIGYQENNRSFSDDLKTALFALSEINITWNILKKDKKIQSCGTIALPVQYFNREWGHSVYLQ